MPPTFVQYQAFSGSGLSQTSPAYTFTAGNLIVLGIVFGAAGAGAPTSVMDTLGNTYHPVLGSAVYTTAVYGGVRCQLYYAYNCIGGTGTITITNSVNLTFAFHRVVEYSGFGATDPLDTANFNNAGFVVPPSIPLTLANANELIVSFFIIQSDVGGTWLWTDLTDRAGNPGGCICDNATNQSSWGDYAGAPAGSYTVTGHSGTSGLDYLGCAAAFIPSAAPAASPFVVIPTFFQ
jgi:hypothetical protein